MQVVDIDKFCRFCSLIFIVTSHIQLVSTQIRNDASQKNEATSHMTRENKDTTVSSSLILSHSRAFIGSHGNMNKTKTTGTSNGRHDEDNSTNTDENDNTNRPSTCFQLNSKQIMAIVFVGIIVLSVIIMLVTWRCMAPLRTAHASLENMGYRKLKDMAV